MSGKVSKFENLKEEKQMLEAEKNRLCAFLLSMASRMSEFTDVEQDKFDTLIAAKEAVDRRLRELDRLC